MITVTRIKRKLTRRSNSGSAGRAEHEFAGLMSFLPKESSINKMFTFSAYRRACLDGGFLGIIHLAVNNVLPVRSPVFKLVQQGRMDEFQEMLRDRKASLRDHDEYGASLLFVSTYTRAPIGDLHQLAAALTNTG